MTWSRTYVLVVSWILVALATSPAQSGHPQLLKKLQRATKSFGGKGEIGIFVRHLKTGVYASIRGDEVFPSASLIKVPILAGLCDRTQKGQITWRRDLVYATVRARKGEDILACFKDGERIQLPKVVHLMAAFSDNTASLWCQELAGGSPAINRWLEINGFKVTRVNSLAPKREKAFERYGWGQTTPREMVELMIRIRQGKAVSPAASHVMYRQLSKSYWDGEALKVIPPTVQAASKQGAIPRSRSEVVLVNAPSGDYAFCVITRNQKDESMEWDNPGFQVIREVSRVLWKHFEPRHPWEPPKGTHKF